MVQGHCYKILLKNCIIVFTQGEKFTLRLNGCAYHADPKGPIKSIRSGTYTVSEIVENLHGRFFRVVHNGSKLDIEPMSFEYHKEDQQTTA